MVAPAHPRGSRVPHSAKCAHSEIPSETHLRKLQESATETMLFSIFDKHLIPVWTEGMMRPHTELPQGNTGDHDIHDRSRLSLKGTGESNRLSPSWQGGDGKGVGTSPCRDAPRRRHRRVMNARASQCRREHGQPSTCGSARTARPRITKRRALTEVAERRGWAVTVRRCRGCAASGARRPQHQRPDC